MKNCIKYAILSCFFWQFLDGYYSNLQELERYAQAYPEIVMSDNNDWFDPRFSNFYSQYKPTFFGKIKRFFKGSSDSLFNPQEFKDLVTRLNKRQADKKTDISDTIVLKLKAGEKCVIWGDLHGAYHSLVRDLQELKNLGVINDQLIITQPSMYFIFLGNVVNRSPYSLETLSVILTLLEKNPDRVIYVKGSEEKDRYWENFTMRRALQAYAPSVADVSDGTIPLKTGINTFFDSLPRLIQIYRDDDAPDFIYCVHSDIKKNEISGTYTQAVIYGEHYADIDPGRPDEGLVFLGFIYGTAQWSIVSCPVQVYQKFFNFYHDAFVVFEMGSDIKKSILTLHSNDTRMGAPNFTTKAYDIIFGKPLESKLDFAHKPFFVNEPFEFGSTMDLIGPVFSLGGDVKRGIDVMVQEQNLKGGVQGYLIRPNIFDDIYKPVLASKNMEKLLYEYKIPFVLAPVGSATLLSYLDKVKNKEMLVLFPVTGATILRDPLIKNMIHLRASYGDEVCALIDYMIKEYKSKNFAFFYQDDAYGKGALDSAHLELEKRGITKWIDIPYTLGQISFKEEVDILKKANIDTIGCFSSSLPTQRFFYELGVEYLKNKHIFAMSFLVSEDLNRFLSETGIKYTVSSVVPNAFNSDLPIVKEYRQVMQKNTFRIGDNSLESWIATNLFFDALQHSKPPFTQEKIITYLEGLKNYNLGGLKLTFNPETRSFGLPVLIENEEGVFTEYQQCKVVKNPLEQKFLKQTVT